MAYIGITGEILEDRRVEEKEYFVNVWKIKDFPSLSSRRYDYYYSPEFKIGSTNWHLVLYPYWTEEARNTKSGWLRIGLCRFDGGSPKTFRIRVSIWGSRGKEMEFYIKWQFWGYDSFMKDFCTRSELMKRIPDGGLSVKCAIEGIVPDTAKGSSNEAEGSNGDDNRDGDDDEDNNDKASESKSVKQQSQVKNKKSSSNDAEGSNADNNGGDKDNDDKESENKNVKQQNEVKNAKNSSSNDEGSNGDDNEGGNSDTDSDSDDTDSDSDDTDSDSDDTDSDSDDTDSDSDDTDNDSDDTDDDEHNNDKASEVKINVKQQNQVKIAKKSCVRIHKDFAKLLATGEKSDVTLEVSGVEFIAHQLILFVRCPAIAALLQHELGEKGSSRIIIEDCEPFVFEYFLYHLYTGFVPPLTEQIVFGLYCVADKYLVEDLKQHCLEYIQDTLSVKTFCNSMKLALRYEENGLLQKAWNFALNKIRRIVYLPEWQNFMYEYPKVAYQIVINSKDYIKFKKCGLL